MKRKINLIYAAIIAVLLASCSPPFYQIYKVAPTEKLIDIDNYLVYEDDNCKVVYDFWSQGGNIRFSFYNKTDKNIYLNLEESFFIFNGTAYDYFKDIVRTYTKISSAKISSTTASQSVTGTNYLGLRQTNTAQEISSIGFTASSGFSISYNEQKVICIPSKTSKIITEYKITESLHRDCDLFQYPTRNQIKSKKFSKTESPIIFSNRIAYTIEQSDNLIKFENEFYIAEISNYPENVLLEFRQEEFCGQTRSSATRYIKNASPDKFYIRYTKGDDRWKH